MRRSTTGRRYGATRWLHRALRGRYPSYVPRPRKPARKQSSQLPKEGFDRLVEPAQNCSRTGELEDGAKRSFSTGSPVRTQSRVAKRPRESAPGRAICGLGCRSARRLLRSPSAEDVDQPTAFVAELVECCSQPSLARRRQRDRDAASTFAVEVAADEAALLGAQH